MRRQPTPRECVALKTKTTSATLYAHEPLIEIASPL